MKLWIGTSGFQYPEWKGSFYPEKMPVARMLPYYADRFTTTEVNYSFRRIPSTHTITNWAEATPAQFKFSFKAPQKVTHLAKLHDCAGTVEYFHAVVSGLKGKLGAVLFQLPPTFEKNAALLDAFLARVPKELRAAFEFRHASWLDAETFETLRRHRAALCIAESESFSTPKVVTTDFGYLRLRREDYSSSEIKEWAEFLSRQAGEWKQAFVYFKHEGRGVGPRFARELLRHLGAPVLE